MSVRTPAVVNQRVEDKARTGGECTLEVRTAGRPLTHELRDRHCVTLSRSVGQQTHRLMPGWYAVEVILPGGEPLLHAMDLEGGAQAVLELKLSPNELQLRETGSLFGAPPAHSGVQMRVLIAMPSADAFPVSAEGRVELVTAMDEYLVFSVKPGRALSMLELRSAGGGRTAMGIPAWGESGETRRCWLTVRAGGKGLDARLRLCHPAADIAALYLDSGRIEDALAVMESPVYQKDQDKDPFRMALAGFGYLRHGAIAKALACAEGLTTEHRWLPDGWALMGEIQAREGQHERAKERFEQSVGLGLPVFKDGLSAMISRVMQYQRDGAWEGASGAFDEVMKMAPFVDWGKVGLTISGWPFTTAERQHANDDWTATDRFQVFTQEILPDTFLFPRGSFTAGLDYTEQQPQRRQKYQNLEREQLIQAYRTMYTSRRLDDREILLKRQGRTFFQISGAGHEAVQTAAALVLRPGRDWVFTYYRDRALCLGLGMRPLEMLMQAVGTAADASGGRQMPNDFTAPHLRIISTPGAIGAGFAQAAGCAQAGRMLDPASDDITVVSCGEGATAEGEFWESLNTACLDLLPVLFLVQDNGYAGSIPVSQQIAGGKIGDLVQSFPQLLVKNVDGTDVVASWEALQEAVAWCREKQWPALVHAGVVRPYSHSLSDDDKMYKTAEQRETEAARDPLATFPGWLVSQGFVTQEDLQKLEHEVNQEIQLATEQALRKEESHASSSRHLYSEKTNPTGDELESEARLTGDPQTMADAINRTLSDEMEHDPRIVVFGEDVADVGDESNLGNLKGKGGIFKVTNGLQRKFGSARCFNTPVAESATVGRAIGMALRGLKPIVEIQFMDYIWRAMLQIRNELAATRWRSFDNYSCPVVVRVPMGGYLTGGGAYHSQSGEVAFTHIPGLRVVMPSNALDAVGLLRTAIRCDDPVLFLEPKRLYREAYNRSPYPGPDFTVPFGRAKVVKPGSSLAIITYGALVQKSLIAAAEMERRRPGLSIEVIDLRSLAPYDWNAIAESVTKTSRVLIAHEDWKSWGYGAELAARIARELFGKLDAPVGRVAAADQWIGYHPTLETATLPQVEDVVAEAEKILDY